MIANLTTTFRDRYIESSKCENAYKDHFNEWVSLLFSCVCFYGEWSTVRDGSGSSST